MKIEPYSINVDNRQFNNRQSNNGRSNNRQFIEQEFINQGFKAGFGLVYLYGIKEC